MNNTCVEHYFGKQLQSAVQKWFNNGKINHRPKGVELCVYIGK